MTGSGFPAGVSGANVTVQFAPVTSGAGPTVTVPLASLATLAGTTLRATVVVPASLVETGPTPYHVTLSATVAPAFTTTTPGNITIDPGPSLSSVNPASGSQAQTINVTVTGSFSNFYQGISTANFGPGITVNSVTVTSTTSLTASITITSAATPGATNVIITTGSEVDTLAKGFTILPNGPTITSFAPQSGTVGTIVTINGSNFGSAPQVSMPALTSGSSIALPLQSLSASSVGVVIPSGAATGAITVANAGASASTASPFTVNAANTFSLSASPASANLIQGQSVAYSVQLASTNGFNQLAQLSVSGLPKGINAAFKPSSITVGESSILTLTAPAAQPVAITNISISASATVAGFAENQSAQTGLSVTAPTTTLLGRTVASDALETPLAGVTITTLGADGNGNTTSCNGYNTVSDSAGNFMLTNLPLACTGPQLIDFDGSTATAPPGKYDGVHLAFTLTNGQVTPSPVLVHLPRIDTAEVFYVQQNSATNQTHAFSSIPGVSVTVYAGTTLTLPDGTQPNPFPVSVVQVLPDRLPDQKPVVPTMVGVFYLSFQPTGTHASQPMAVTYPNILNTPPGTDMPLMVLDATHGSFTPIGTGKVSADGTGDRSRPGSGASRPRVRHIKLRLVSTHAPAIGRWRQPEPLGWGPVPHLPRYYGRRRDWGRSHRPFVRFAYAA
jgi:hypothetical protein